MKYLLSNGGGLNSPALAIWLYRNEPEVFRSMRVVFADTGGEFPEVYEQIDRFDVWLKAHGQETISVKAEGGETLEEYSLREKINPLRRWKWCTDKFKIRPINEWGDREMGRPRIHLLGIAEEESHRAKPNPEPDITNRYPLIEAGLRRQDCRTLLESEGLKGFVKSGCFYCPLTPSASFVDVKKKHPDLFERAVAMEKSAGFPLKHKWLEDIVGCKDLQRDFWDGLQVCGPHCFD